MKLKKLGLLFLSLVAALSSCSPASDINGKCPVSQVWQDDFENYRDTDVFIDVSITEKSYEVFGLSFSNDDDFSKFLDDQNTSITSKFSRPAQLLLRSDSSVNCERFQNGAKVIELSYPCEEGNFCFSAYGRGHDFLPPSIAPPPSIKTSEITGRDKSE
jgi:hypothetical protein